MSFLRSAEAVCVLVNNPTVLIVLNMETQRVTSNKKQHMCVIMQINTNLKQPLFNHEAHCGGLYICTNSVIIKGVTSKCMHNNVCTKFLGET